MRFLFFDTECANCYNGVGKLCEFGYVLTDEKFKIIKTDNLLINPKTKFNVYGFKQAGISFAHSYGEYYRYPTLKERYEEIKQLLTDRRNLVVGYSTDCDANYLLGDLNRNSLFAFNFRFLDVAKLYRDGLDRRDVSLDNLYEEAEKLDEEIVHHEARGDALMTMAVFKQFLRLSGEKTKNLQGLYPDAFGEVFEGRLTLGNTAFRYTRGDRLTAGNKRILDHFVRSCPIGRLNPKIVNKRFCFSREYEHTHFVEVLAAAQAIISGGGKYINVISRADTVVYPEGEDLRKIKRMAKKRARFITIAELCGLLDLPADSFDEGRVNADLILARLPENEEWFEKFASAHKRYLKEIKKIRKSNPSLYS